MNNMNDPDINDPKKPANEPKPISSWGESNENQTPAYNDPDNWDRYSNPQDSNTNYQAQPPTPETAVVNPETPLEQNYQSEQSSSQENSYGDPSQETGQPEEIVGQSQPEQPQNQPMLENPASPPKPKSSMGLMIIMVTVVIILLGATGLFAFQNYQLRQEASTIPSSTPEPTPSPSLEPTPEPSIVPSISPSPTPDPTLNWDSTISKEKTYFFKHPDNVVVTQNETNLWTISLSSSPSNPFATVDGRRQGDYKDYQQALTITKLGLNDVQEKTTANGSLITGIIRGPEKAGEPLTIWLIKYAGGAITFETNTKDATALKTLESIVLTFEII